MVLTVGTTELPTYLRYLPLPKNAKTPIGTGTATTAVDRHALELETPLVASTALNSESLDKSNEFFFMCRQSFTD